LFQERMASCAVVLRTALKTPTPPGERKSRSIVSDFAVGGRVRWKAYMSTASRCQASGAPSQENPMPVSSERVPFGSCSPGIHFG
jgi:hypothetical protein